MAMPDSITSVQSRSRNRNRETKEQIFIRGENVGNERLYYSIKYSKRLSRFSVARPTNNDYPIINAFWMAITCLVLSKVGSNLSKKSRFSELLLLYDTILPGLGSLIFKSSLLTFALLLSFNLQVVISRGSVRWSPYGIIMQCLLEIFYIVICCFCAFYSQEWSWLHRFTFMVTSITYLMKIHSFAFYCGFLSNLDKSLKNAKNAEQFYKIDEATVKKYRRELTVGSTTYPDNLTISNMLRWALIPSLCYEIEFPLAQKISIKSFLKNLATFALSCAVLCLFVEEYVLPVVLEAQLKYEEQPFEFFSVQCAIFLLQLLHPVAATFLAMFMMIWHTFLNMLADITGFEDRMFYDDWWMSSNQLEFSPKWNVPVHRFLKRHVHIPILKIAKSRIVAVLFTFLISSIFHEVVMDVTSMKFSTKFIIAMCMQIPVNSLQTCKFMRKRRVLNNIIAWIVLPLGLSSALLIYAVLH
ncbi:MBOAT, membrane-bound O-acyltransferase family-domain-containing protein [Dipodascopsis uninucleata]